jgi:peptidoglycan/xylan/chitin deacetylase (PgdA/CDA1 family)
MRGSVINEDRPDPREQQPWQWPDDVWRRHVDRVRAGRRLVPTSWPDGHDVAVAISFDADHETIPLRDGETRPGKLSQGEYGSRVGTPRILAILEEFSVPATNFMPAVSALLHPDEVRRWVDGGHEIAMHGWIHERNMLLAPESERDLLFRAADVLERLSGRRPVGLRTPSWDFSDSTLAIIRELGLQYDSSLMADDEPYELLENGVPTGIVEIPVEWIRDDAVYFTMDRYTDLRPYTDPRTVLQIWKDEFDAALADRGVFQLTLHPHVIGHRSRLPILRGILEHIAQSGSVWFARHDELATLVRGRMSPTPELTESSQLGRTGK